MSENAWLSAREGTALGEAIFCEGKKPGEVVCHGFAGGEPAKEFKRSKFLPKKATVCLGSLAFGIWAFVFFHGCLSLVSTVQCVCG